MKCIIYVSVFLFLISCTSIPQSIKQNKDKFIQIGLENSKQIDFNELSNFLESSVANNTEAKMKYLGIDTMKTIYVLDSSNDILLDSVVIFKKSNYVIVYDFTKIGKDIEQLKKKSKLKQFEKIDERLYIGKN